MAGDSQKGLPKRSKKSHKNTESRVELKKMRQVLKHSGEAAMTAWAAARGLISAGRSLLQEKRKALQAAERRRQMRKAHDLVRALRYEKEHNGGSTPPQSEVGTEA
jgi:hypothetical protein